MFTCWLRRRLGRPRVGLPRAPRRRPSPRRRGTGRRSPGAAQPLLHVTEWDVPPRARPAARQGPRAVGRARRATPRWSSGRSPTRRTPSALDDPDEALGRAYGAPSAVAFDLEWYAGGPPVRCRPATATSRTASSTGSSSSPGGAAAPRRGAGPPLAPLGRRARRRSSLPDAYAHTGLRAPFAFPDGTVADWVLTPDGWRSRAPRRVSLTRRRRDDVADGGAPS